VKALLALVLVGCGASTQALSETPTATTRPTIAEAPPASTSDRDRERLIQSVDDMNDTQRAYRELRQQQRTQPPPTMFSSPAPTPR
jgi:hypothetical protein